jgi:glycosyltransferase involved in cell wall biosynthesis
MDEFLAGTEPFAKRGLSVISSQTAPMTIANQATQRPRISVVIPSTSGAESLAACLDALGNQSFKTQAEVIVLDCGGPGVANAARNRSAVKLVSFPERKSIPELRAIGMRQSEGEIVAVIEDHCNPESHWYERMLRAHERFYGVIGGAVENDPSITRTVDWAVFLCEYSRYMNPVPNGEVADLPGNNVSYRREFLSQMDDLLETGRAWEGDLHARLREKGVKLYSDPSIIVYHKKEFGFGYFVSQRYHYSRSYAGHRVARKPYGERILRAASCVILPLVLMTRISWTAIGKKRHLRKSFRAVPALAVFLIAWSWGEFVGYLFGPGKSLLRVD